MQPGPAVLEQEVPANLRLGFINQHPTTIGPERGHVARIRIGTGSDQLLTGSGELVVEPEVVLVGKGDIIKAREVYLLNQPIEVRASATEPFTVRKDRDPFLKLIIFIKICQSIRTEFYSEPNSNIYDCR